MPAKIKTDLKDLKKVLKGARSKASIQIKREIVALVKKDTDKGLSSVAGFNLFKKYAKSTAKKKGRRSPVTLRDTNLMMDSLTAIQRASKVISLLFKGTRNNKIAGFHHNGTKHMPVRPVIPASRGQKFKKRITKRIFKIVNKALALSIK